MKKLLFTACLVLSGMLGYSQAGLENLIVEKVPVPATAGLPAGSMAYRVFVDMAPNWGMQLVQSLSNHTLLFSTTTQFYNHEDGAWNGRALSNGVFNDPAGRWDSYCAVNGVTSTRVGVLYSEDTDGTVDGFLSVASGSVLPMVSVGDDFEVPFGSTNYTGTWSTNSGIYNVNGDEKGRTPSNTVLIGQFTTNGDFNFEMNVQIRRIDTVNFTPVATVENYVARDPEAGEFLYPKLIYSSVVIAPTVSIVPISSPITLPATINIEANAADANGTVTQVQFFRNGSSIGIDNTPADGFRVSWTVVPGSSSLTAVATDNDGNTTTSAAVVVNGFTPTNAYPEVNLTAPANGTTVMIGSPVILSADATDSDGTIASVEFVVDGQVFSGSLVSGSSYSYTWTTTIADQGPASIYARTIDNLGAKDSTSAISIYVQDPNAAYRIETQSAVCNYSDVFCVPIIATSTVTSALGFDMALKYDKSKVHPTGIIFVSENLIANENWTATSVNILDSLMNVSLYLNGSAPAGTKFNGNGQLICVEFAKTENFKSSDTADFSIDFIYESYANNVAPKVVTPGSFITYSDNTFTGTLLYWKDNSPIGYTADSNLITNIFGSTNCINKSAVAVQPNANGVFNYNIANGNNIKIERDIEGTTDVMDIINAADAQLAARVAVNDPTYKPNVYQMIAMDVNRDGQVSAGDVSQINYRTVLKIAEFQQVWNYDVNGNKINGNLSEDWVFVDQKSVYNSEYRISSTFPANDNVGYSKFKVPVADTCFALDITGGECAIIVDETYKGILLGDVNGSYSSYPSNPLLKSASSSVVIDLGNAVENGKYIDAPVYVNSDEEVTSLDIAIQSDVINGIMNKADYVQSASHMAADKTMRYTSYSLNNYELSKSVATIRFEKKSDNLTSSDLKSAVAYVNGNPTLLAVKETEGSMVISPMVNIYPNPSNGIFGVKVSEAANLVIMDLKGITVLAVTNIEANQMQEINISDMADGMYLMKVSNDNFVTVKTIVKK